MGYTYKSRIKLTDITITVRKATGTLRPEHMHVPTVDKWLRTVSGKPASVAKQVMLYY